MNKKARFGIVMFGAMLVVVMMVKTLDAYHFITHDQYMPPLEKFPQLRTNTPVMEVTTHTQSRALTRASRFFVAPKRPL